MDTVDCIATKLDVREFSPRHVPGSVKLKVLEAARLTGSGTNRQHWRFVLVQERAGLEKLAGDSATGKWVGGSDFAIIVLTDPTLPYHAIDAGRALQDMQLAAWNFGVASCLYMGVKTKELRADFRIPDDLNPTAVLGFGYPMRKISGRKSRLPLPQVAFQGTYGVPVNPHSLR